jgi:betaine-homocysteine S-methyltransferase
VSEKIGILDRLAKGVVLGAEGYVFELERRGYVKAGPYVPEVVLDYPEALRQLHREFLRAGSEVMVAMTYYGDRDKLKTVGREGELEALNRQALRIAREVAAEGDALVAGNISNTWVYDHNNYEETSKIVRQIYTEQVEWAAAEGADFIIAETLGHLGEGLLALEVIKKFGLPAMINFGSTQETLRDGYSYVEACKILEKEGAEIVGMNCSRGPETMMPILKDIRQAVSTYVAALPVPYRTTPQQFSFQSLKEPGKDRSFPIGLDPFVCTRFEMADFAAEAQQIGVNYIGICCGGAPHHVRAMAETLGRTPLASRYSPDLSLHPMIGKNVQDKDKKFLEYWKD